ncbi:GAF domain-containing protein, partial [Leptolyngbya sp. FACHB-36]|uniref:GAF domain-containing protein n=1 Tax=Leptolyngbya sp. FACHB-36 TaxID=2692808 RepID=UPI00167FEDF6
MNPEDAPIREAEQLEALRQCPDVELDAALEDIVQLAAAICETPIAAIHLLEEPWVTACVGLEQSDSRTVGLSQHCALHRAALVIADVLADERFANHSGVADDPPIRFYAGVPLLTSDEEAIGTLCVVHTLPHELQSHQIDALWRLSRQATSQLELRRKLRKLVSAAAEQKQVEQSLRQSEVHNQALIHAIPDLMLRISRDGVYLNAQPSKTVGLLLPPNELVGKREADVLPADIAEQLRHCREQAFATGETQFCEYEILLEDGIHSEETRIVVSGEAEVLKIVRDVTDRKRAEQRLSLQYAATQVLAEAANLDEAMHRLLQVICEMLRWDLAELWILDSQTNGLRCAARWHMSSLDATAFDATIQQLTFASGVGLPSQVWQQTAPIWIPDIARDDRFVGEMVATRLGMHSATGFPVLSSSRLLGVISLFSQEVQAPNHSLMQMLAAIGSQIGQFMERIQAQDALQHSNSLLRAQQDAAIDGILVVNERWQVTSYNRRFCELWQVPETLRSCTSRVPETRSPAEDVNYLLDWLLSHLQKPDEFITAIESLSADSSSVSHTELALLDGRIFDCYSNPVLSSEGTIYGRICYFRDITERKRADEALQSQNQRAYLLNAIALRIRQSLNLKEILDTTAAEVRQFLDVDRVLIYQFDPDWNGTVVVESVDACWRSSLGAE